MAETNYCPRHPRTETNLRCGRCDELVCPQCMVHTPVGVRCKDCAQTRRVPTYDVSASFMARAVFAGVAIAVGGGVLFAILDSFLYSVAFLPTIAVIGLGYAIGEGISRAVNRRRGGRIQWVAGGSMLLAYVIITVFSPTVFGFFALIVAFYLAIIKVR